ncbi:MAG: PEP-CTERM sorting domain-containing protein [Planctomycetia bacterium]|nr:PEP-CTERM sorting domain-containing protein [Planctomycetia bacterium]
MSCVTCPLAAAEFRGLGDLPGGGFASMANGVTADGNTIVGLATVEANQIGFIWRDEAGMLPVTVAYHLSTAAIAVSDDGSRITGDFFDLDDVPRERIRLPFRWKLGDDFLEGLGGLAEVTPDDSAFASDISANGSVVVGMTTSEHGEEGFIWTAGVGMRGIGDLPGGSFFSEANAVSADGTRVVGRSTGERGEEAFIWDADHGMVGLGFLNDNERWSRAMAMSPNARFVVGQAASAAGTVAFLWTLEDGMREIGDLPAGIGLSVADAVSADGSVVVGAGHDDAGQQAIFWSESTGLIALKDLLAQQGLGDQLAGWRLTYAHDISDDGRVIVGEGWNPQGEYEAWRAVVNPVPEPSTLALGSLTMLALTWIRQRRIRTLVGAAD